MDFAPSARSDELKARLVELDTDVVRPAEAVYREQRAESGDPHFPPPVMEELKVEARKRDLWNLFMPEGDHGAKLSNHVRIVRVGRDLLGNRFRGRRITESGESHLAFDPGRLAQACHSLGRRLVSARLPFQHATLGQIAHDLLGEERITGSPVGDCLAQCAN